jgi:hypothetical protein
MRLAFARNVAQGKAPPPDKSKGYVADANGTWRAYAAREKSVSKPSWRRKCPT